MTDQADASTGVDAPNRALLEPYLPGWGDAEFANPKMIITLEASDWNKVLNAARQAGAARLEKAEALIRFYSEFSDMGQSANAYLRATHPDSAVG